MFYCLYHKRAPFSLRVIVCCYYFCVPIGGLHYRHVGVQNKTKFVHIVCIKMEVYSQRRNILLFRYTNMTAMTSHANHQYHGHKESSCSFPISLLKFVSKNNNHNEKHRLKKSLKKKKKTKKKIVLGDLGLNSPAIFG